MAAWVLLLLLLVVMMMMMVMVKVTGVVPVLSLRAPRSGGPDDHRRDPPPGRRPRARAGGHCQPHAVGPSSTRRPAEAQEDMPACWEA